MEELLSVFGAITFLGIVKWMVVLGLVVYNIFGYLMMRQVKIMTRAVSMKDDYVIRVLAIAHEVVAVLVLLLSIMLL